MGKTITTTELDARLDELAQDPASFTEMAKQLAAEFDDQGTQLEIRVGESWRKPSEDPAERVSLAQQFRNDVDTIEHLDREAEAKLARRIEFSRLLLERALESAGMTTDDLDEAADYSSDCAFPGAVCRRSRELHALRTELVERNLYLVLINVERYAHTTASQHDLIQEGSAALFRAVDGFDWRRGLLFRTYAVHWLNQAFRSYLYNFTNTVRVPVYLQKAMKHVNDAKNRLGNASPSVPQIAEEADMPENLVASALGAARSSHSLDLAFEDDGEGGRLKDLLEDHRLEDGPYTTDLEDATLEESLSEAMERLSDRERYVVQLRFGIGVDREHTLAEVAKNLGVSLERVRQIQVRAVNKLRNPSLRRAVDPFLN